MMRRQNLDDAMKRTTPLPAPLQAFRSARRVRACAGATRRAASSCSAQRRAGNRVDAVERAA
jgi:hypothetical protein